MGTKMQGNFFRIYVIVASIFIGSMILSFVPAFDTLKDAKKIRKNFEMGSYFSLDRFQGSLTEALHFATQIYLEVDRDSIDYELHRNLFNNMINIKEVFAKIQMGANPKSIEKNFRILDWHCNRFIDSGNIESFIQIKIKRINTHARKFKYFLATSLMDPIDEFDTFEMFVKPLGEEGEDFRSKYGRKIRFERIPTPNYEIRLLLTDDDFNSEQSSEITIISNSHQELPYSFFHSYLTRYIAGVDGFTLVSNFKSELEDYRIGWYDPITQNIRWEDSLRVEFSESDNGEWGVISKSTEKIFTYTFKTPSVLVESPLFQYRQSWDRITGVSKN